jgi:hypothetical protein
VALLCADVNHGQQPFHYLSDDGQDALWWKHSHQIAKQLVVAYRHVAATETALTTVGNHNCHIQPKTVRNQLREFRLRAHWFSSLSRTQESEKRSPRRRPSGRKRVNRDSSVKKTCLHCLIGNCLGPCAANQAIELNPKDADAFIGRGVAYAKLKQFEKAIQDYNQAIELNT